MKKVLLAINGIVPDRKILLYVLQFSQRIKADLDVLQIVDPRTYSQSTKKIYDNVKKTQIFLETSMVASAFAEAGEEETARKVLDQTRQEISNLLQDSKDADVACQVTVKAGKPENEITSYLDRCRNVVVTFFHPVQVNARTQEGKKIAHQQMTFPAEKPPFLIPNSSIPFVVLRRAENE